MIQKGTLESVNQSGLGFYSHFFSGGEGDGWLEISHQSIHPQWLCHPDRSGWRQLCRFWGRSERAIGCSQSTSKTPNSRSPSIWTLACISGLF